MSNRYRAYSDPSSPTSPPSSRFAGPAHPSRTEAPDTTSAVSLTQESLARLQVSDSLPARPRWAHPSQGPSYATPRGRLPSVTPSTTSVSDGEDEDDGGQLEPVAQEKRDDWLRKGKEKEKVTDKTGESAIAGTLPPEILLHIFRLVDRQKDLQACMRVNKTWCLYAFSLLWNRPVLSYRDQLVSFARILASDNPSLPYAIAVKRINLSAVAHSFNDNLLLPWKACTRAERVTLGGSSRLTAQTLAKVLGQMPNMIALDLNRVMLCDDRVLRTVAETAPGLQGLNLNGCAMVGDESMKLVAERCRLMRRLKVNGCLRLSDESLVAVARSCPLLLEVDCAELPLLTSATIYAFLLNSTEIRELKAAQNTFIDSDAFPNLPDLFHMTEAESQSMAIHARVYATTADFEPLSPGPLRMLRPSAPRLDSLKVVDLTNCSNFGDRGLKNLVESAPRLRLLTLAKCGQLSDEGVKHIGQLGKYLHHLHLAHLSLITDVAVTQIARSCTRLRYVDVACCTQLTDLSVFELSTNLLKLRRIGLVKVAEVTDEAIYALVERAATLERIHLSYCQKVSVKAITFLLNKLPRLTHLSLTGVSAFKVKEYQQFCRPPPDDFNEHQSNSFCVFSGAGIAALRNHLNSQMFTMTSDDGSTRRHSASSSSSDTADGPTLRRVSAALPRAMQETTQASTSHSHAPGLHSDRNVIDSPTTFSTLAARRASAPLNPDRTASRRFPRTVVDTNVESLNSAFASAMPNFLSPTPSPSTSSTPRRARNRDRDRDGLRLEDRRMPGSFSNSAVSSLADDDTYAIRISRPLPSLPSPPAHMSSSAAELARSRAQRSGASRQSHFYVDDSREGRQSRGSSSSRSGTIRQWDDNRQEDGPARRQGEAGSSGSPLRWMAGFVGWGSERERAARERERDRD